MRTIVIAIAMLAAAPVAAQTATAPGATAEGAQATYRTRVIDVFGTAPCPRSTDPNEIIVCARHPESDQFRIPQALRVPAPGDRGARSVAGERAALLGSTGGIGGGECTAVGANAEHGCVLKEIQKAKGE